MSGQLHVSLDVHASVQGRAELEDVHKLNNVTGSDHGPTRLERCRSGHVPTPGSYGCYEHTHESIPIRPERGLAFRHTSDTCNTGRYMHEPSVRVETYPGRYSSWLEHTDPEEQTPLFVIDWYDYGQNFPSPV